MQATIEVSDLPLPGTPLPTARRQGHPVALSLWRLLRDRSEADRRFVLAALEKARRASKAQPRIELSTQALWEAFHRFCRDPAAKSTSAEAYRRWHAAQPDRDKLPSEAKLRRALGNGSWTTLLERAHQRFETDPTVRRLTALGPFFTEEEIVGAIKHWLRALSGKARLRDFLIDCRERQAQRDDNGPRLPLSCSPINRFGGWQSLLNKADADGSLRRAALKRAGLDQITSAHRVTAPARSAGVARRAGTQGGRMSFTHSQIKEFVRCAQGLKGTWISRRAYDQLAHVWRKELLAAGERPWAPTSGTICTLLEMGWLDVLAWAADISPGITAPRSQGIRRADEELEDQLSEAMDELGEDLTLTDYSERREQLKKAGTTAVATERTLRDRLGDGSWPVAVERVRRKRAGAAEPAAAGQPLRSHQPTIHRSSNPHRGTVEVAA